jgi:hypothetical protein
MQSDDYMLSKISLMAAQNQEESWGNLKASAITVKE